MKACFAVALSLAATARAHIVRKVDRGHIVPPIEDVEGDKKFYGPPFPADYPHDIKPEPAAPFKKESAAYPKLQDRETFHDDFVSDDDSDGGHWDAQMSYDTARAKVSREHKEAKDAVRRESASKSDVEVAAKKVAATKRREVQAAAAAHQATEAAEEAQEKAAARQKETSAKAAEAQSSAEKAEERRATMEKVVQDARDALETQQAEYKKCEQELEDAKAKVEDLEKQEPNLAKEGQHDNSTAPASAEEKKALEEARARSAQAEANHHKAMENLAAARESNEHATKQLQDEEAESSRLHQRIQKEVHEVLEAERELERATSHLRQVRGVDAAPGKPPSPPPPKAAAHRGAASAALALSIALAACHLG